MADGALSYPVPTSGKRVEQILEEIESVDEDVEQAAEHLQLLLGERVAIGAGDDRRLSRRHRDGGEELTVHLDLEAPRRGGLVSGDRHSPVRAAGLQSGGYLDLRHLIIEVVTASDPYLY